MCNVCLCIWSIMSMAGKTIRIKLFCRRDFANLSFVFVWTTHSTLVSLSLPKTCGTFQPTWQGPNINNNNIQEAYIHTHTQVYQEQKNPLHKATEVTLWFTRFYSILLSSSHLSFFHICNVFVCVYMCVNSWWVNTSFKLSENFPFEKSVRLMSAS